MKNKIKKYTNLSVLTAVAISGIQSQVFATSVLSSAMSNFTSPGAFKEVDSHGKTISTDYYTGGVSYSFGNTLPPPVFAVSPPTINAGCNGINIKGMFVSLLGLDQLGSMLQNAGASLAWGVAIGLIYSLPGVASAFKMINQWAKDLQKLLGNACQSGIMIGQYLAKQGINKLKSNKKLMNWVPNWAKCSQEGSNCVATALGLGKYFSKSGVFDFGGTSELPQSKKSEVIVALLKSTFNDDLSVGSAYLTSLVKKNPTILKLIASNLTSGNVNKAFGFSFFALTLQPGGASSVTDSDNNTVNLISIDSIANLMPSETAKTRAKLGLWSYVLLYNFVGDLITRNTNYKIKTAFDLTKGTLSSASGNDKKKALQEKQSIGNLPGMKSMLAGAGSKTPASVAGVQLAEFIEYGKINGNYPATLATPAFVVVSSKESQSTKRSFRIIARDPSEWSHSTSISDYQGVEKSSNCAVREKINDGNAIGCSGTTSFPVLIANINYFVRIIKNSPVNVREKLTQALIKYNDYKMAVGLLNNMLEVLQDANSTPTFLVNNGTGSMSTSNAPTSVNGGSTEQLAYMQKANATINEAKKHLKKLSGGITEYTKIYSMFKAQELENRSRGMKNTLN